MLKKIIKSISVVLVIGFIGLAVACSNQQDKSASITFGQESENSCKLELVNNTGKTITSLSIKTQGQENANKLDANPQDSKWTSDQTADVFLPNAGQSSANTEAGNIAVKSTVDVAVTFEDNTSSTIHNVVVESVSSFENAKLSFSTADNLVYLEYNDSNGNQVSTLVAEQKIVADAKAAEEAARQQAESQANSPSNYYGGSSSNQYSEGCTGGNIAIR